MRAEVKACPGEEHQQRSDLVKPLGVIYNIKWTRGEHEVWWTKRNTFGKVLDIFRAFRPTLKNLLFKEPQVLEN